MLSPVGNLASSNLVAIKLILRAMARSKIFFLSHSRHRLFLFLPIFRFCAIAASSKSSTAIRKQTRIKAPSAFSTVNDSELPRFNLSTDVANPRYQSVVGYLRMKLMIEAVLLCDVLQSTLIPVLTI